MLGVTKTFLSSASGTSNPVQSLLGTPPHHAVNMSLLVSRTPPMVGAFGLSPALASSELIVVFDDSSTLGSCSGSDLVGSLGSSTCSSLSTNSNGEASVSVGDGLASTSSWISTLQVRCPRNNQPWNKGPWSGTLKLEAVRLHDQPVWQWVPSWGLVQTVVSGTDDNRSELGSRRNRCFTTY